MLNGITIVSLLQGKSTLGAVETQLRIILDLFCFNIDKLQIQKLLCYIVIVLFTLFGRLTEGGCLYLLILVPNTQVK